SSEVGFGEDLELVRSLLSKALHDVDVDEVVDELRATVRGAQRAEAIGVLEQAERADDAGTRWRARRHLAAHWEDGGAEWTLVSRVGLLLVPADEREAVAEVLDGIRDPAELDPELRRRLALAGVLVPVD